MFSTWKSLVFMKLFNIVIVYIVNDLKEMRHKNGVYHSRTTTTDFTKCSEGMENIIIPMKKVQYVNANQVPLLRKYRLYTITFGTTTSTHQILFENCKSKRF
jgi:membrane protein YdbS with pleckstrin-like domain